MHLIVRPAKFEKERSNTYNVGVSEMRHWNANEAKIEARSLPVPGCNQRGKMLQRSLKRRSQAKFQCGIPEVMSFVVMDVKSCVKTCKYFRKP